MRHKEYYVHLHCAEMTEISETDILKLRQIKQNYLYTKYH